MSEPISIHVSCSKLKDEDVLSKSDPFVIIKDLSTRPPRTIGKTEVCKNNLNPVFSTPIEAQYTFETKQSFVAEVWDYDQGGDHDLLGQASFTVGQMMSASQSSLTLDLQPTGRITLLGSRDAKGVIGTAQFMITGKQLRNLDTFGKSDPFFVLSRVLPNGNTEPLHKSEVIDDNLNPRWMQQPPLLDLKRLCGGDADAPVIKIEVFDEDVTDNEKIGEALFSLRSVGCSTPVEGKEIALIDSKRAVAGYVVVQCTVNTRLSFLDLLKAGLQLNIAFSVDFTGSNLECKNPKSLHFYHPTQPNQYIQSMLAISDVVQEYDSDRNFPAFGFGAMLPGSHEANHFFHLNLGPNPYISGMQAVIDTYVQTVQQIRFYGPTNFAPTIRNVANGARQAPGVYTILLIMTDGEITDLAETIIEIKAAVTAPLSILIVGVGQADFGSMERLDGDGGARLASRDIVQFVAMRDFINRSNLELSAALLAEIPSQVVAWSALHPEMYAPLPFVRSHSVGNVA